MISSAAQANVLPGNGCHRDSQGKLVSRCRTQPGGRDGVGRYLARVDDSFEAEDQRVVEWGAIATKISAAAEICSLTMLPQSGLTPAGLTRE
jgi:hypothetical protein